MATTRRIRVIGIGPGDPDQVTIAAVRAMNDVDYFLVTDTARSDDPDPLVVARDELLARHLDHEARLVVADDPSRDRSADATRSASDTDRAISEWHAARTDAWERALLDHAGDVGVLAWGDPAFNDSAIRMLHAVLDRGRVEAELSVVPGISSLQLLAARHGIVLHEVGQPVHVTTGRRLHEAVAAGEDNIVVLLNRSFEPLADLGDWQIWWGANLGTAHEQLVTGRVSDVLPVIETARNTAKDAAGWAMDVFLLRRP